MEKIVEALANLISNDPHLNSSSNDLLMEAISDINAFPIFLELLLSENYFSSPFYQALIVLLQRLIQNIDFIFFQQYFDRIKTIPILLTLNFNIQTKYLISDLTITIYNKSEHNWPDLLNFILNFFNSQEYISIAFYFFSNFLQSNPIVLSHPLYKQLFQQFLQNLNSDNIEIMKQSIHFFHLSLIYIDDPSIISVSTLIPLLITNLGNVIKSNIHQFEIIDVIVCLFQPMFTFFHPYSEHFLRYSLECINNKNISLDSRVAIHQIIEASLEYFEEYWDFSQVNVLFSSLLLSFEVFQFDRSYENSFYTFNSNFIEEYLSRMDPKNAIEFIINIFNKFQSEFPQFALYVVQILINSVSYVYLEEENVQMFLLNILMNGIKRKNDYNLFLQAKELFNDMIETNYELLYSIFDDLLILCLENSELFDLFDLLILKIKKIPINLNDVLQYLLNLFYNNQKFAALKCVSSIISLFDGVNENLFHFIIPTNFPFEKFLYNFEFLDLLSNLTKICPQTILTYSISIISIIDSILNDDNLFDYSIISSICELTVSFVQNFPEIILSATVVQKIYNRFNDQSEFKDNVNLLVFWVYRMTGQMKEILFNILNEELQNESDNLSDLFKIISPILGTDFEIFLQNEFIDMKSIRILIEECGIGSSIDYIIAKIIECINEDEGIKCLISFIYILGTSKVKYKNIFMNKITKKLNKCKSKEKFVKFSFALILFSINIDEILFNTLIKSIFPLIHETNSSLRIYVFRCLYIAIMNNYVFNENEINEIVVMIDEIIKNERKYKNELINITIALKMKIVKNENILFDLEKIKNCKLNLEECLSFISFVINENIPKNEFVIRICAFCLCVKEFVWRLIDENEKRNLIKIVIENMEMALKYIPKHMLNIVEKRIK